MAPAIQRATLRKSRNGCETCRARKVKCDEARPVCGNCRRRFIEIDRCEYRDHRRRLLVHSASAAESDRDTPSGSVSVVSQGHSAPETDVGVAGPAYVAVRPVGTDLSGSVYSLELRLVHHFGAAAWQEMPRCHGFVEDDMWEVRIPRAAFESRIVLEPLLAISALHLHSQYPGDSAMSLTMSRYLDQTLAKSLDALTTSSELTEPLFLAAIIIVTMSWVLAHRKQPGEPYRLPIQPYHLVRGLSGFIFQNKKVIDNMGYGWYVEEYFEPIVSEDFLPTSSWAQLQDIQDDLDKLMTGFDVDNITDDDARAVYRDSATYVLGLYKAYFLGASDQFLQRFIPTMPLRVHPEFVSKLADEDPLLMAILARSLVLLKFVPQLWWLRGCGEYEVLQHDIEGITDLMPEELRWAMDWPQKVVTGEIVLIRESLRQSDSVPDAVRLIESTVFGNGSLCAQEQTDTWPKQLK